MQKATRRLVFPKDEFTSLYRRLIRYNRRRERHLLSEQAFRTSRATRRSQDGDPDRKNIRPAFARDADRIIHCKAYSRYIDKTQVFFLMENDHITHRVLHVQIVAKIARTICRALRLNEDLAEAIALAHDLGHTPFGHAGETFLNHILQEKGCGTFVHNAQSVRLLDVLENDGKGLNLTLQVLDGVVGHNGELLEQRIGPQAVPSWEKLDSDVSRCFREPKADKKVNPSTLEGCIVRLADVIAYVGRDVEDAIEVKLIERTDLPGEATEVLGSTNRNIINNLTMDVIQESQEDNCICLSAPVYEALQALLKYNYQKIYLHDRIQEEKERLEEVFRRLFAAYLEDLQGGDEACPIGCFVTRLGDEYRADTTNARIVADFMAGMTDDFLLGQFRSRFMPHSMGYRMDQNEKRAHLDDIV